MLRITSALPAPADGHASVDHASSHAAQPGAVSWALGPSRPRSDERSAIHVEISPSAAVARQTMRGQGITAELIQSRGRSRIEVRYRGPSHLLLAHEHGMRRGGEMLVDGRSASTPRDFAHKLTFVPAGHDYVECRHLNTSARLLYIYLDPVEFDVPSAFTRSSGLNPRLFFEDAPLWGTVNKLKGLIESAGRESLPYFEALGAVLRHELLGVIGRAEAPAKGGLAAWQQRLLAAYIEDHLSEHIALATLANLAHLSPYHFSRAFKQSFGVPPHRYHTYRRIERAKLLLERHASSVTDIALSLGFHETSSFTTIFRKVTGLTPSRYHRSVSPLPAQN